MPKLLACPPLEDRWAQALRDLSPDLVVANAKTEEEAVHQIADADAYYGRITPAMFAAARRLRWIQTPIAGLEGYFFPEVAHSDVVVTNMRGVYSDHIADHVFAYVLCFARGFHELMRRQIRHEWAGGWQVPIIHLADTTLGIVGLGGIGEEVARRGAACHMRVLAVDARRAEAPTSVAELRPAGELAWLLGESDFVVVCAPETPETRGLFDARRFAQMKPAAFFINVGRGKVVQLDALTTALQERRIAGAGLDVFEVEPLPSDHPLWDMQNVILTPHTAGNDPHNEERRMQVLVDNARRWLAGKLLQNVVDKRQGY